ncbi:hypothetical protein P9112_009809 [Eukaryota sp. TZLM1-RC]
MGLFSWFFNFLNYLGLFQKKARILLLGLDNAGKSTLLNMLKYGKVSTPQPTQQEVHAQLMLGSLRIDAIDLGGHETARAAWRDHYVGADAVVFVVDANDSPRFSEARKELHELLNDKLLETVPFVILGNKIDLPGAVSEAQLKQDLGIGLLCTGKQKNPQPQDIRPLEVFMCSVVEKTGFAEAFKYLSDYL